MAVLAYSPLAKGLLTGKFTADSIIPENDVRFGWSFREGAQAERLKQLGVAGGFQPGASLEEIVQFIRSSVRRAA